MSVSKKRKLKLVAQDVSAPKRFGRIPDPHLGWTAHAAVALHGHDDFELVKEAQKKAKQVAPFLPPQGCTLADAKNRKPDETVRKWRQQYTSLVLGVLPVVDIPEIVMDFLIPFFVTMPNNKYDATDSNIIDLAENNDDRLPVYRIASLGALEAPIWGPGCLLQRIAILLIIQPFSTYFSSWGSDACDIPEAIVDMLDRPENVMWTHGKGAAAMFNRRTRDSLYQTRIVLVARHALSCSCENCRTPSRVGSKTWPGPRPSMPFPIPSGISHRHCIEMPWIISHRCYCEGNRGVKRVTTHVEIADSNVDTTYT